MEYTSLPQALEALEKLQSTMAAYNRCPQSGRFHSRTRRLLGGPGIAFEKSLENLEIVSYFLIICHI